MKIWRQLETGQRWRRNNVDDSGSMAEAAIMRMTNARRKTGAGERETEHKQQKKIHRVRSRGWWEHDGRPALGEAWQENMNEAPREAREEQRLRIKATLTGDGRQTGSTRNRYDFLEEVLFEILDMQTEHLTNPIAFLKQKTWELTYRDGEGSENFWEKYAEKHRREELRGIMFIAVEKSKERVIIIQMYMDLLEAKDIDR